MPVKCQFFANCLYECQHKADHEPVHVLDNDEVPEKIIHCGKRKLCPFMNKIVRCMEIEKDG